MKQMLIEQDITREVDTETGVMEVKDYKQYEHRVSKLPDEPNYIKLYIKSWCAFKQVKQVNQNFLFQCLQYMTYADDRQGQTIYFNPALKRNIAHSLGWSEKTGAARVNNEIKKLVKANIFKWIDYGSYQVNPQLVGRGRWQDVYKLQATFNLVGDNAGEVEIYSKPNEDNC